MHEVELEVKIDARVISKRGSFNYLRFIIDGDGEIDDDVTHFIGGGWAKLRVNFGYRVIRCRLG